MTPMLDQRERKITVFLIAKCAVEGGKQPAAKHQRKTRREQCRRNPTVRTIEKIPHGWRREAHFLKRPLRRVCDAYSTIDYSAIRPALRWTPDARTHHLWRPHATGRTQ